MCFRTFIALLLRANTHTQNSSILILNRYINIVRCSTLQTDKIECSVSLRQFIGLVHKHIELHLLYWFFFCQKLLALFLSVYVISSALCAIMSSASLAEKRSLRKSHSHRIATSSTSITSAPPTTSDSKKHDSDQRSSVTKEKSMRSKQRDSLPELRVRKGNRSVRASNFELSSSANDFESTTNHHGRQSAPKAPTAAATAKPRTTITTNVGKTECKKTDDKILEMLKMDSLAQENYKLVSFFFCILMATKSR